MSTAAAAPATVAASAACAGDGLSPPTRLANAPLTIPAIAQLRLDDLRPPPDRLRDDDDDPDELERFELPLPRLPPLLEPMSPPKAG